ncbi:ATP-binding protein, partial [Candidatus Hydrogenedentota bacterium]
IAFLTARHVSEPLRKLEQGARLFAMGQLKHRLPASSVEEVNGLAQAMNQMAKQLDEKIKIAMDQRNEFEAVLYSMTEGVMAVDHEEIIISINESAGRFFHERSVAAVGRNLQEVVRNSALQVVVSRTLAGEHPVEGDIVVGEGEGKRHLKVRGTLLKSESNAGSGAVIVMNDVTRLRELELMRKDFVANVSHELRTPITSIKGYIETLLDGALDEPEDAKRFLEIASRSADRLAAIIDDLLSLSKLEEHAQKPGLDFEQGKILPVVDAAILLCRGKAAEKDIDLVVDVSEERITRINGVLLEQAVINLIDNAIKYSDAGTTVSITGEESGSETVIAVRDHGPGIEKKHLSRIFERFYRADKGRSRKAGGTGLGLAIVKHIAQVHGGRVSVESVIGEGSVFRIHLPII